LKKSNKDRYKELINRTKNAANQPAQGTEDKKITVKVDSPVKPAKEPSHMALLLWTPIPEEDLKSSVWQTISHDHVSVNVDELEVLFKAKPNELIQNPRVAEIGKK
jgi:hypothetical protein